MNEQLELRLTAFRDEKRITQKGSLSVMLHVTRLARDEGLPLDPVELQTKGRGQVRGLSVASVQKVLRDYGIKRVLAREGGRTSRGSIGLMEEYVALLNQLNEQNLADLPAIEEWWVHRVKDYLASQPFIPHFDAGKSLRAIIQDLLEQVEKRQTNDPGATYLGSVLQHLVGAKLELVTPGANIEHHGVSVADAPTERAGDFVIDRTAIHVTTAPGQALMQKCQENLSAGYSPIIVTLQRRLPAAESIAEMAGIEGRIDILAAEQFLAANLHELSGFRVSRQRTTIDELIQHYNVIVDQCETDPSLRIRVGK